MSYFREMLEILDSAPQPDWRKAMEDAVDEIDRLRADAFRLYDSNAQLRASLYRGSELLADHSIGPSKNPGDVYAWLLRGGKVELTMAEKTKKFKERLARIATSGDDNADNLRWLAADALRGETM